MWLSTHGQNSSKSYWCLSWGFYKKNEFALCDIPSLIKSMSKPRSHVACNRSATSLRPKFRVVAGRLQGGCKEVADWLQTVAGTIWSQGGFGCCKWNLSATKSIVERFLVVADRSPTGWRLIADQSQRLQTIPTQFLVADWSPTSRRSVADRSPKSCRLSAIINKRSRYSRQPVVDRSPIGCQSLPNWLPTDRRRVSNHCPITRQYSINTRSLSAPEPMLDLSSVSTCDINLKAILWRQFYKRYFNHRSLKLTWKLLIWYFFQI